MGDAAAWTIFVARVNVHLRVRQTEHLFSPRRCGSDDQGTSPRHAAEGASRRVGAIHKPSLSPAMHHPSPITTITSQAIPCLRKLLHCLLFGREAAVRPLRACTHKHHDVRHQLHKTPRCRCPSLVSHGAAVRQALEPRERDSLAAHRGMLRLEQPATMFHHLLNERAEAVSGMQVSPVFEQHLHLATVPIDVISRVGSSGRRSWPLSHRLSSSRTLPLALLCV
jgi:hypothetical protein